MSLAQALLMSSNVFPRPVRSLVTLIGIAALSGSAGCTPSLAKRQAATARATAAYPATTAAGTAAHPSLVSVNTTPDMVTTGKIVSIARELLPAVSALRAEIFQRGGFIQREDVQYTQATLPSAWNDYASPADRNFAVFTVKVPTHEAAAFLQWLLRQGTIVHQEIVAERVPDHAGSQPRPPDDASGAELEAPPPPLVTFEVVFVEASTNSHFEDARFTARVRATGLMTNALEGSSERQGRYGVGMGMRFGNTELDVTGLFATEDQTAGVMLTMGQVFYGRTLGNGRRRAFNPYMTLRTGYASLDRNYWVVGSELGVELLKAKGILLAVGVGPTGLIGSNSQLAVEANASLGVAF